MSSPPGRPADAGVPAGAVPPWEPPTPPDEARRLAALRSLQILDTADEERFDRYVRLARNVLDVPIALISLVDGDRQWFKACSGMDIRETSRSVSFGAHAILGETAMVVPDLLADDRFREHPLVLGEPHARFYAGHPLRTADGSRVGTLCILDRVPRQLDATQLEILADLAAGVEDELANVELQRHILARRDVEDRVQAVVASVADGIITLDVSGYVLSFNPAAERMFTTFADQVLGQHLSAFIPEVGNGPEESDNPEPWMQEAEGRRLDGATFPIEYTITSLPRSHGAMFVAVVRDVTRRREAERELRDSEARQRSILESSIDAIFLTTPDGRVRFANRSALELFEVDAAEVYRNGVLQLADTADPGLQAFIADAERHGHARALLTLHRARGSTFPAEIQSTTFEGPGGERLFSTFVTDVTDRVAAEAALRESEERFRAVFDRAPLGIVRIGPDRAFLGVNPAYCAMMGRTEQDLLATPFRDLLHPDDWRLTLDAYGSLLDPANPSGQVEHRVLHADGEYRWHRITATAVRRPDGSFDYVVGVVDDVTERRRVDAEMLEAMNAQAAANRQLEKVNRMMGEFVSIVGHEFRTALMGIQGFGELIQDESLTLDEVREYAADIQSDAQRINRLITDMLDLDRLETGRAAMLAEDSALNDLLAAAATRAGAVHADHALITDLDPDLAVVRCDPARVLQAVDQLVSNAVRFSEAGTTVVVRSRLEGEWAHLSVVDHGIGLPAEALETVFDRHARLRQAGSRTVTGAGLGLAIVRQVIDLHGGRTWAESVPGQGATFHVLIPVAGPPA